MHKNKWFLPKFAISVYFDSLCSISTSTWIFFSHIFECFKPSTIPYSSFFFWCENFTQWIYAVFPFDTQHLPQEKEDNLNNEITWKHVNPVFHYARRLQEFRVPTSTLFSFWPFMTFTWPFFRQFYYLFKDCNSDLRHTQDREYKKHAHNTL